MLESLITSKTRIKLLLKFFLNTETAAYMRGLAEEMGESTNAIRIELNRLTKAGILRSYPQGRTILYGANKKHPLYPDLHGLMMKYTGIDKLVDSVIAKLGSIEFAFIAGDYAQGIDSGIIDVIIVGNVDRQYLESLVQQVEELISRKIRSLVLNREEFDRLKTTLKIEKAVIIWNEKNPMEHTERDSVEKTY